MLAGNGRACCCAGIQCSSCPNAKLNRITKVEIKNKMLNKELTGRAKEK
jgi:hypothetical protein